MPVPCFDRRLGPRGRLGAIFGALRPHTGRSHSTEGRWRTAGPRPSARLQSRRGWDYELQFGRFRGRGKSATTRRDCNLADGLGPAARQWPSVECGRPVCGLSAPKMAPNRPRGPKRRQKHGTGTPPLNPPRAALLGFCAIFASAVEYIRVHLSARASPHPGARVVLCDAWPHQGRSGSYTKVSSELNTAPKRGLGPPAPEHRRVTRQATVKTCLSDPERENRRRFFPCLSATSSAKNLANPTTWARLVIKRVWAGRTLAPTPAGSLRGPG